MQPKVVYFPDNSTLGQGVQRYVPPRLPFLTAAQTAVQIARIQIQQQVRPPYLRLMRT